MKFIPIKLAGIFALSLLLGASAHAITFDLNFGDSHAIGSITPGHPDSDAVQVDLINLLLPLSAGDNQSVSYNSDTYTDDRTSNFQPSLGDATLSGSTGDTSGSNVVDFGSGFKYLLVKYGTGVPNADGNAFYVWNVSGLTGTMTVPVSDGNLSHWALYNPGTSVPDGGTTAVLLGLGLVGLSFIARRRKVA